MTGRLPRDVAARLGLPDESGLFGRVAAYGLFIALAYWLVAHEPAGAILLAGFGVATGVVAAVLQRRRHRVAKAAAGTAPPARATPVAAQAEGPFGDPLLVIPGRSPAPFLVGLGLAVAFLGLVFGAWLTIAGGIVALIGARTWVAEVIRESRVID